MTRFAQSRRKTMTKTLLPAAIAALLSILAGPARAEPAAAGLVVQTAAGTVRIEPWGERIVRVVTGPGNYNPAVVATPAAVQWTTADTADYRSLSTGALEVRVARADGAVTFFDAQGRKLVAEAGRDVSNGAVVQGFDYHGPVFGLGQHQNGKLDYRGTSVRLQQANRDVAVPMFVSPEGFGILWNNASVTQVDADLPAGQHPLTFRSEAGNGVDYHFILGPELDDVIGGYRELTGRAPLMARWTWGLWQSKEHYATQAEVLDVAARHRAERMPLDAVVQDWQYWTPGTWGEHAMDPARYPDPKGMLDTLHAQHVHAIVSVWARFDDGTRNGAELKSAGALYPTLYNNVYPAGKGHWYDAYAPHGRDLYWRQIARTLGTAGWDGWWLDASEAELGGWWGQMRDVATAAGPGKAVYNAYPLLHTRAVFEGSSRDAPGKRPFILTRSAYSGQQRNAAVTWSGDTMGTWDVFRAQLPAALNFTLSGIPYWSADIGGFFGGDPADPAYAELYTRWYQFAAFNPMFRVHGTGKPKEFWRFDAATQRILRNTTQLRYRLLPYIYSASWNVTSRHGTMMRALAMDFRTDAQAVSTADQYMFGPALLVAPVMTPNTNVRTVYLPAHDDWFDFRTGKRHAGGKVVAAQADIATIPVFVRAGSILPLGPVVQYADERSDQPLEVRVYPGRDGTFELYDDAGDGMGYTRGEHAILRFAWDQARGKLSVAAWDGGFPGMRRERALSVRCGTGSAKAAVSLKAGAAPAAVSLPGCR
jgi:alpha-D-xyloside xylohydrolase